MSSEKRRFALGLSIGLLTSLALYRPPYPLLVALEHSGWPLAVLAISLCFRSPLSRLLDRIKGVKGANHEILFSDPSPKEVEEFANLKASESENNQPKSPQSPSNNKTDKDRLLTDLDPSAATISFWSRLYGALLSETDRLGFRHGNRPTATREMLKWLDAKGYLEPAYIRLIQDLFVTRNRAAHGTMEERDAISSFEAKQYLHACEQAIAILKQMQTPNDFPGSLAPDLPQNRTQGPTA